MKITALLLLMLLFFTSCAGGGSGASTGDNTSGSAETTEDPQITALRSVYPLLEPTEIHLEDISLNMKWGKFRVLAEQNIEKGMRVCLSANELYKHQTAFFVDDQSRSVMLSFYDNVLYDIKSFPYSRALTSPEVFQQISAGTALPDVIEQIGLPFSTADINLSASELWNMDFLASDGRIYRLFLGEDRIIQEVTSYATEDVYNHPTLHLTNISKDDIEIGMTREEYRALVGKDNVFCYDDYAFQKDENGNLLVVHFDGSLAFVEAVDLIPKRASMPTSADFEKIEEDMPLYEVVELVGAPYGVVLPSNFHNLLFETNDGKIYIVWWQYGSFAESDFNLYVSSVELIDFK